MSSASPWDDITCNHCGKSNYADSAKCWLCRQPLRPKPTPVIRAPRHAAPEKAADSKQFDATLVVLVLTLLVVGFGLKTIRPGLLIPYIAITIPTLASTFARSYSRRNQDHHVKPMEKGRTFFVDAASIFASTVIMGLAVIGVVAILLFAVACLLFSLCHPGGFH